MGCGRANGSRWGCGLRGQMRGRELGTEERVSCHSLTHSFIRSFMGPVCRRAWSWLGPECVWEAGSLSPGVRRGEPRIPVRACGLQVQMGQEGGHLASPGRPVTD